MVSILLAEDDPSSARYMRLVLEGEGHEVRVAENGVEALVALEERLPALVITDLEMPEMGGMELLTRIRQRWPDLPVIVASVLEEVTTVVGAVRAGAVNYVIKPATPETIQHAIGKALVQSSRKTTATTGALREIRGRSRGMVEVRHLVALAARCDVNLLITGETGTGKEVVSRAVHRHSKLAELPFVAHNCAATPPELFESQFFGHVKGSFTGATHDHAGLLEAADGGVLFLDELGSMPLEHQAKLLRVMDDGEVRRVGGQKTRRVSVRFFAAVNRPPAELIRQGTLREDLYYRLCGIEFFLPPLRERTEDIPELADWFLGEGHAGFTPEALEVLREHDWPGNVRQLRNVVQSALAFAGEGLIEARHLSPGAASRAGRGGKDWARVGAGPVRSLSELEAEAIQKALRTYGGNQSQAARALGIDRSTLRRKLAALEKNDSSGDLSSGAPEPGS